MSSLDCLLGSAPERSPGFTRVTGPECRLRRIGARKNYRYGQGLKSGGENRSPPAPEPAIDLRSGRIIGGKRGGAMGRGDVAASARVLFGRLDVADPFPLPDLAGQDLRRPAEDAPDPHPHRGPPALHPGVGHSTALKDYVESLAAVLRIGHPGASPYPALCLVCACRCRSTICASPMARAPSPSSTATSPVSTSWSSTTGTRCPSTPRAAATCSKREESRQRNRGFSMRRVAGDTARAWVLDRLASRAPR